MRIHKECLCIVLPSGEVKGIFGVEIANVSRGRELAERQAIYFPNTVAIYRDKVIPWIIGPMNDVILDHPDLPKDSRSKYRQMDDSKFENFILGETYEQARNTLRKRAASKASSNS